MKRIFGPDGLVSRNMSGYEDRPGQEEMARAVERALDMGQYLVVEAGTGTGKTLAYLIPVFFSGFKTVISTGTKNLQEQVAYKDIPLTMQITGLRPKICVMKGRANYICIHRWANLLARPRLKTEYDERYIKEIARWMEKTDTGDKAELKDLPEDIPIWDELNAGGERCLGKDCPYLDRCFITRMRREAAASQIIVVNHHLFFADMAIKETGYGEVIPRYEAAILDEAHQIEDVATQYFGFSVSNWRIEELARDALSVVDRPPDDLPRALQRVRGAFRELSGLFAWEEGNGQRIKPQGLPQGVPGKLADLVNSLNVVASIMKGCEPPQEVVRIAERAKEIADEIFFIVAARDPDFVSWREKRGRGFFFHASPIDVSDLLRQNLYRRSKRLIFTSATITTGGDFSYFMERLGLDDGVETLCIPSPFDYKKQVLIFIPRDSPDPADARYVEKIAPTVKRLLAASRGRAFVLFTSYRNMQEMYEILKNEIGFPVMIQGEAPKSQILSRFREEVDSVLFATSSFWEGVDVSGEALSCVIIDKLPFASPSDPLVEARIERLSQAGENPFMKYQVPAAIIALKQGMGRLIRNRSDRGVLALMDSRVLTKRYGKLFIESMPPAPITHDISDVERFFGSG